MYHPIKAQALSVLIHAIYVCNPHQYGGNSRKRIYSLGFISTRLERAEKPANNEKPLLIRKIIFFKVTRVTNRLVPPIYFTCFMLKPSLLLADGSFRTCSCHFDGYNFHFSVRYYNEGKMIGRYVFKTENSSHTGNQI